MDEVIYAYVGGLTKSRDDKGFLHVKGLATDDTLDLDGQMCDPDWLNTAMPAWFKTAGNIREMHQLNAVGKATELTQKGTGFEIGAKIVDPSAALKTEEGIFTGFSIGIKGAMVDKSDLALSKAANGIIVGGKIVEVSLVDIPSNPSARLELAKTVGNVLVKTGVLTDGCIPCPTCAGFGQTMGDGGIMVTCEMCGGSGEDAPDQRPSDAGGDKDDGEVGENDEGKSAKPDPDCDTCKGTGKIREGHVDCPKCVQKKSSLPDDFEEIVEKRAFSDDERKKMASKGEAMPNGGFPINSVATLKDAIQSIGRAKDPVAAKKHIIARAEALGKSDLIPQSWKSVQIGELASVLAKALDISKAAEADQWLHDPTLLGQIRDGIISCLNTELSEMSEGQDERYDISQLGDVLNTFLSWWMGESMENETTSPFKGDEMSFIGLGVSADLIKAASADDATDESKSALKSEVLKALDIDVEKFAKSQELAQEEIKSLRAELDDVKKMAAPRGISLRATQYQQSRFSEVEKLTAEADRYKTVGMSQTDPSVRAQYMEVARDYQDRADTIRKSLEGE